MAPIPKLCDSNINDDNSHLSMPTTIIADDSDSDSWVSDTSSFDDIDPNDDIYEGYEMLPQIEIKNGYRQEIDDGNDNSTAEDFIFEESVEIDNIVKSILDSDMPIPSSNSHFNNDDNLDTENLNNCDRLTESKSIEIPESAENNFADFDNAYKNVIIY